MLVIEPKQLYKQLIEKYKEKQIVVAIEELSELQKELCKSLRGKTNIHNILEEIADVLIMIEQMKLYFNLTDVAIASEIDFKLNRTAYRLLKEKEKKSDE